jgi:intein/homing endonuclease
LDAEFNSPPPPPVLMHIQEYILTETEKAYLAGLIDGEGTITLTISNKGQMPQPQLSISNTNLGVLEWVKQKLGCGSIIKKNPRKPNHKVSYAWQINRAGKVMFVLSEIKDYLIIKKSQALLILDEYKKVTPRNGKYSKEMLNKKITLVNKIKSLNL